MRDLHVPVVMEVTRTPLPTPSPWGPGEMLRLTAPQALGEEGNLLLPFEGVWHKQILDSDHENSLIPLPGQASRPLPAPSGETRSSSGS